MLAVKHISQAPPQLPTVILTDARAPWNSSLKCYWEKLLFLANGNMINDDDAPGLFSGRTHLSLRGDKNNAQEYEAHTKLLPPRHTFG